MPPADAQTREKRLKEDRLARYYPAISQSSPVSCWAGPRGGAVGTLHGLVGRRVRETVLERLFFQNSSKFDKRRKILGLKMSSKEK